MSTFDNQFMNGFIDRLEEVGCLRLSLQVGERNQGAPSLPRGAVAELVGIECGVVSGVFNLESSGIEVPDWRPRHDKHYHEA
jgi:hypothetical protein